MWFDNRTNPNYCHSSPISYQSNHHRNSHLLQLTLVLCLLVCSHFHVIRNFPSRQIVTWNDCKTVHSFFLVFIEQNFVPIVKVLFWKMEMNLENVVRRGKCNYLFFPLNKCCLTLAWKSELARCWNLFLVRSVRASAVIHCACCPA